MKSIFLLLLFCYSVAQAQTVSLEISDMAAPKKHYAYLLAGNKITAVVENESCDSFFLTTNNGTLKPDAKNKCTYVFRPDQPYRAQIFYHKKVGKDTIIFQTQDVHIKPWPFVALLGGDLGERRRHFNLTKEVFIKQKLSIEAHNTGLSARLNILAFSLVVTRNAKEIYSESFKGYTQASIDKIKNKMSILQPKDIVSFRDIKYDYSGSILLADDIEVLIEQ